VRVTSTSIAAFHTAPIISMREQVLEVIESFGAAGCITDDVIAHFSKTAKTNTGRITGRFSELENEGKMVRVGDTRPGASGKQQMIMRATAHAATMKPVFGKTKKNPFLAGMKHAARIVLAAGDYPEARAALKRELIKAAKR